MDTPSVSVHPPPVPALTAHQTNTTSTSLMMEPRKYNRTGVIIALKKKKNLKFLDCKIKREGKKSVSFFSKLKLRKRRKEKDC